MAKQNPERRNPREDRTRLAGVHFRKDNPEAGADDVLGSLLEVVRCRIQLEMDAHFRSGQIVT